jgi:hypothetical protein
MKREKEMTNIINLPSFAGTETAVTLLEAGSYELEIKEIRQQTIKGGRYAGQPVLNVGLATSTNVWVWKQLPMFDIEKDDIKGLTWLRMSTMAFAIATGSKKGFNLDTLIGKIVGAEIGVQPRADRPDENQNFVKTFTKLEA